MDDVTLYAVWKDDPLSYAYNDALGGWEVKGFKADAKDEDKRSVYIPFLHEGEPVKGIGELAFRSCDKLVAITMPQSVEIIGDSAFSKCPNLSTVIMPSVVSIGEEAFIECSSLSSITMPSGLKLLGANAFESCISIKCLTIPTGLYSIGNQSFLNCSGLESIKVEEDNLFFYGDGDCLIKRETNELILGCRSSKIPAGVQSIGASAFSGCSGLVGIDVPEGVESIGRFAFTSCKSLVEISLPQSLASIGECAFYFCEGLVSIDYNGSIEQWKSLEKASNWDAGTKDYTIHCKDGEIVKSK